MYDGDWQNDVKHGQGTQQLSHGMIFKGTFANGGAGAGVLELQGDLPPSAKACAPGSGQSRAPCV